MLQIYICDAYNIDFILCVVILKTEARKKNKFLFFDILEHQFFTLIATHLPVFFFVNYI